MTVSFHRCYQTAINHSNHFGRSPESLYQCPEALRRERTNYCWRYCLLHHLSQFETPILHTFFYMIKWHQYHGNLKKTQFPESIDEMESGIYSTREKGRHQTFLKHATYNKAHHVTILEQENRENILTFSLTPDIWHHKRELKALEATAAMHHGYRE